MSLNEVCTCVCTSDFLARADDGYNQSVNSPSTFQIRARCQSIFSSIAIELNAARDGFSSIAIELTFFTLGHGFKKADSVLSDIYAPGIKFCGFLFIRLRLIAIELLCSRRTTRPGFV